MESKCDQQEPPKNNDKDDPDDKRYNITVDDYTNQIQQREKKQLHSLLSLELLDSYYDQIFAQTQENKSIYKKVI